MADIEAGLSWSVRGPYAGLWILGLGSSAVRLAIAISVLADLPVALLGTPPSRNLLQLTQNLHENLLAPISLTCTGTCGNITSASI